MMKKKLAAVIIVVTVLAGCTSTPALANTDPAAEEAALTESAETTENSDAAETSEQTDSEIVRDGNTDAAQDQNGTGAADPESNAPLTPAGNVVNVISYGPVFSLIGIVITIIT